MDMSKLSRGQMIAAAGGALLIISLFLHWDSAAAQSAWSAFSGMDIIMLLIAIAALVYVLATAAGSAGQLPGNAVWIVFILGVLSIGWALGWDLEDPSAGIGAWLGLVAGIGIAYGACEAGRAPAWPVASHAAPAPTAPGPPVAP